MHETPIFFSMLSQFGMNQQLKRHHPSLLMLKYAMHANGGMGKLAKGAGGDDCGLSVLAKKLGEIGWA